MLDNYGQIQTKNPNVYNYNNSINQFSYRPSLTQPSSSDLKSLAKPPYLKIWLLISPLIMLISLVLVYLYIENNKMQFQQNEIYFNHALNIGQ